MKSLIFALCLLLTTAAFGQSLKQPSLSNQPQGRAVPSHPRHAGPQPMAQEVSLLGGSRQVSARGANPLWESARVPDGARVSDAMPLGDVARLLREQHATAKKATIVLER
jgi:glucose/arabinose dehydrogenase